MRSCKKRQVFGLNTNGPDGSDRFIKMSKNGRPKSINMDGLKVTKFGFEKFYLQQFGLQKQQLVCLHMFLRCHRGQNRRLILVDSQLCIWHHLSSRLVNQLLYMLQRNLGKRRILHLGKNKWVEITFILDCSHC